MYGEITKAAGDNHQGERGLSTVSHRNGRGPGGRERVPGTTLTEERPPWWGWKESHGMLVGPPERCSTEFGFAS